MTLLRRVMWWLRQRSKEAQLREELQFHLEQEARERRDAGLPDQEAAFAARRDLGNEAKLREDVRAIWTWRPVDELSQDLRFAFRTLFKTRAVALFAILSLALGIGANTAIYSFMDAILLRSLPIADPGSLIVMSWRSKSFANRGEEFVARAWDGSTYRFSGGLEARIFPFVAYERLRDVSEPVFSSLFAHFRSRLNIITNTEAEISDVQFVSGDFFGGLAVSPAAGRPIQPADDRPGAPNVAVLGHGYSARHFGSPVNAVGQSILINNQPFTVVGIAPPEFFGVDPSAAPGVYVPLRTLPLFDLSPVSKFTEPNYYWLEIMGRLRPGVSMAQAQAALATPFESWVKATAANDAQRANLPRLHIVEGAGGLDTLRRRYSRPLYVLLAMVGLILAIACANTANLLLARATVRRREIAVRLSIGAGRFRLVRQLLTESLVLASISGALGVLIAIAGMRLLTVLLANGSDAFTLRAELNWRVLSITLLLSMLCGVIFGLAPAIQSTRPALVPALKDAGDGQGLGRRRRWMPRLSLQKALVAGQIAMLMLLLIGAGLFMQTVTNLHSVFLGFDADNLLLLDVNATQAGLPPATVARFYDDLQQRFAEIPGVRAVTSSHSSLVRAGRSHPVRVDGVVADGTRFMQTGPGFFSAMKIPMLLGREIDERDRAGSAPVAVVSDQFAKTFLPGQDPLGRRLAVTFASRATGRVTVDLEIVGVAATARYGGLKTAIPPVVYVPYAHIPSFQLQQMTFALRTDGDPLRHVSTIRQIVNAADSRVPVTNVVTQAADLDRMINQEIVMARLGTTFAILALVIACVGLYGTMSYGVARRTREIGIRVALGARRGGVVWMVMREALLLTAVGLALSIPLVRGTSRFIESFLFDMTPNDARAITIALVTLITAALLAAYAPARRASRIDPQRALREE
jgi:macrolide transport system ATP-binding/permease protein